MSPARPPHGLVWTEELKGGVYRCSARPEFSGRQVLWMLAGFVALTVGVIVGSGAPKFGLGLVGMGVSVGAFGARLRRRGRALSLGMGGFAVGHQTLVDNILDVHRFEVIVAETGAQEPIELLQVLPRAGRPVDILFAALDIVALRFVAARLNTALSVLRENTGYRGWGPGS